MELLLELLSFILPFLLFSYLQGLSFILPLYYSHIYRGSFIIPLVILYLQGLSHSSLLLSHFYRCSTFILPFCYSHIYRGSFILPFCYLHIYRGLSFIFLICHCCIYRDLLRYTDILVYTSLIQSHTSHPVFLHCSIQKILNENSTHNIDNGLIQLGLKSFYVFVSHAQD